ncbi:unnamed protein product [Musa textilis]
MTGPVRARSRRLSELCKRRQRLQTSPKRSRSSSFCSRVSTARSSSSVADQTNKGTHEEGGFSVETQSGLPSPPPPPLLAGESFAVASWSESVGSTGSLASHPG